ncbi:MAG: hypothetical protein AAB941_01785 [Patescibacteria group bacterium]
MKKLQNVYGPPKQVNDTTYSIDVMAGANITGTIAEAIGLARGLDTTMQFDFNGVTVSVRSDSNPELIYRDWSRSLSGYIGKSVGPNPNPVLTDAEKASDACIKAKNDRESEKRHAEYEKKARAHREKIEAKLVNATGIELADEAGWQKFKTVNSGGYGGAIVTYSERWARLMQVEMTNGKKLEDVADATSQEADLEGISGFMYGCAVSTLAACWKYCDQLRRWHNIKTQLGNEGEKANESGGVLNPALLSIG